MAEIWVRHNQACVKGGYKYRLTNINNIWATKMKYWNKRIRGSAAH